MLKNDIHITKKNLKRIYQHIKHLNQSVIKTEKKCEKNMNLL